VLVVALLFLWRGCGRTLRRVARAFRLPAVLLGPLYGIIVWVGSYEGLLPTFNLLSDAGRHPDERNAVKIAAHLVSGAFTGLLIASLPEEVLQ
jgi:hypothetical protein